MSGNYGSDSHGVISYTVNSCPVQYKDINDFLSYAFNGRRSWKDLHKSMLDRVAKILPTSRKAGLLMLLAFLVNDTPTDISVSLRNSAVKFLDGPGRAWSCKQAGLYMQQVYQINPRVAGKISKYFKK